MARAKVKQKPAELPTTATALRFQRVRAKLSAAKAAGDEKSVIRLRAEIEPLCAQLGVDERGYEYRPERAAGRSVERMKIDVVGRLLERGLITPDHAATADRIRDTIEALLAHGVRGADLEEAVDLGARASDPIERWRKAAAASPGEWLKGAEPGAAKCAMVREAPRSFGYKRIKAARSAGDGMSAARLEVLQKARTLNRALAALEASANRTAGRIGADRKRLALEKKAREIAEERGLEFEPFDPRPCLRARKGETDPLAFLILKDVVLDGLSVAAVCKKRFGQSGGAQSVRAVSILLQGLEFVALCDPFHK